MYQKISRGWFKHWDFILLDFAFFMLLTAMQLLKKIGNGIIPQE